MDVLSLLGVGVSILVPTVGGVLATGKLFQRVKDQEGDIADLKDALKAQREDIDRAEAAAAQVAGLAAAIEHLTEKFTVGLNHIGELFRQNNEHVKTQLSDIKDELKHVRSSRTSSPPRERRVS